MDVTAVAKGTLMCPPARSVIHVVVAVVATGTTRAAAETTTVTARRAPRPRKPRIKAVVAMTRVGTASEPTSTEETNVNVLCEGRTAAIDHTSTGRASTKPTRPLAVCSQG
ncbi:hypothetical protein CUAC110533_08740 [Cutibacterium acnes subsp. elongatum]